MFKKKSTPKIWNDMVACFSSDNFLLNLRKAWLQVISHKVFSLFLILFTLWHNHFQYLFLMIDQSELFELATNSLICLNIRANNIVTIWNILEKIWSGYFAEHWRLHQFWQKLYVVGYLTLDPTPTSKLFGFSIKIKIRWLKQ